jgi:hypothetical protein
MFIVMNLSGEVVAEFNNERNAHMFADIYGEDTGRYAFVEYVTKH